MYRRLMSLSHRPTREGSTITEAHVPAYLALELATTAYADALSHFTNGLLTGEDVVIAQIEASFGHELLVGNVDVDVVLRNVGRSSLGMEVTLAQNAYPRSSFAFELVHLVDGRSAAIPGKPRDILESLMK
ncbi:MULTISPECIES: hypothetical protein [Nocardiaceae]|uniref:hypothetical protein n=1 Tax=Nocardiaceae TaxID=85025 RepID=UPI00114021FF|nr:MULTISPECIES: hypothetical protein [Rhodococcus]